MLLSVDPSNIPTTTRGDGCAVNTKGNGCAVNTSWWKVWYQGLLFKVLITSSKWHYQVFLHLYSLQSTRCNHSLRESQDITQAFCSQRKEYGTTKWGPWYYQQKQCPHSQLRVYKNGQFFGSTCPIFQNNCCNSWYFGQSQDSTRWNWIYS